MAPPDVPRPGGARALGVLGILGGLGLLAAFVVDIPPAVNSIRIVLFYVGPIAIVVAVTPWQARVSHRLALDGAVPLVVASAWALGWFVLGLARERPFAGDFGLAGFYAGLALWLADAWFGLVALRIGVMWRPASFVLAVGSLPEATGEDQFAHRARRSAHRVPLGRLDAERECRQAVGHEIDPQDVDSRAAAAASRRAPGT